MSRARETEHMTRAGAEALASRITKYWQSAGKKVSAYVVEVGFLEKQPIYGVRSNMVNGMPR